MDIPDSDLTYDSPLIRESINGNRKSQFQLYKLFAGNMYAICLHYAGNVEDAQDILQDGFIKFFTNLSQFEGRGSFRGWASKIFKNTCIEHLRKKNKLYIDIRAFSVNDDEASSSSDKVDIDELITIIQSLPSKYRIILNFYMVDELTHIEISKLLNIPTGTSRSRLARGRKILKIKYPIMAIKQKEYQCSL